MHCRAYALIGPAAADIRHRLVYLLVGRARFRLEQGGRRHDLSRLAIAALRHIERRPGLLHWMQAVDREALDGDDAVGGLDAADRDGAGAPQLAVDVHRARAALRDAAAVLGSRQARLLADGPQQRRVGLHLHVTHLAIDVEL